MKRSKKSLILEYIEMHHRIRVAAPDAAAIRRLLHQRLGEKGRVSDRYLLAVLEERGVEVDASLGGLPREFREIIAFDTLSGAAQAIAQLDARRAAEPATCIRAARRARESAELVARNPRVNPGVRKEREEIALWFRVWMETPDVFASWLEVRMNSREFAERFLA